MMLTKKQLFWGYNANLQHELKKQQCITQKGKLIYTKILYLNVKKNLHKRKCQISFTMNIS